MPKTHVVTAAVAAAVFVATGAAAQQYPIKPITIIVSGAAGSSPDLVARTIAQKLNEAWRQPVIVDARPGAGATIGAEMVAKAAPDGYTLLLHAASHIIAPSMYKLSYDTIRDFAGISRLVFVPNLLVVHRTVPAKNAKELITLAKSKPGVLNYSTSGSGTPSHLAGEMFKTLAGINIVHVPYKGSPQAMTALLSGEAGMSFSPVPLVLPHAKTGKLKILGVTTARRSKIVPEIPTIAESGLPDYEVTQWYGMQAPAATPRPIIAKLNAEVQAILGKPDVVDKLSALGAEPAPTTPEALDAYVQSEVARWGKAVKASGAKVD